MGFLIVSTLSLFWYPYCPYCLGCLIVPYTHCPLDCYCIPTIACLLLLTFCVCLIVLCRTIGSVGISRVLCMPWSTSSFYLTGVPAITCFCTRFTHPAHFSHTLLMWVYHPSLLLFINIILAFCCSSLPPMWISPDSQLGLPSDTHTLGQGILIINSQRVAIDFLEKRANIFPDRQHYTPAGDFHRDHSCTNSTASIVSPWEGLSKLVVHFIYVPYLWIPRATHSDNREIQVIVLQSSRVRSHHAGEIRLPFVSWTHTGWCLAETENNTPPPLGVRSLDEPSVFRRECKKKRRQWPIRW